MFWLVTRDELGLSKFGKQPSWPARLTGEVLDRVDDLKRSCAVSVAGAWHWAKRWTRERVSNSQTGSGVPIFIEFTRLAANLYACFARNVTMLDKWFEIRRKGGILRTFRAASGIFSARGGRAFCERQTSCAEDLTFCRKIARAMEGIYLPGDW